MTKKISKDEKAQRRAERGAARVAAEATVPPAETEPETLAAPVQDVPIQELELGQRFELDSDIFVVKTQEPEGATAAKLEYDSDGDLTVERWQRPVIHGTLVVPKE